MSLRGTLETTLALPVSHLSPSPLSHPAAISSKSQLAFGMSIEMEERHSVDSQSLHLASVRAASPDPLTDISSVSESDSASEVHDSGRSNTTQFRSHSPRRRRKHRDRSSSPRGRTAVARHTNTKHPIATQRADRRPSGDSQFVQRPDLPAVNLDPPKITRVFDNPDKAWTDCVKALREHDEHIIKGWKEDVDSLLVFAGLFSAVLTAFNIESYKLLQEDPEETTAALLRQISAQLASGGTIPTPLPEPSSFRADTRSVRINILWFSSLVLSLVSASIGILTKQWLREYVSNTSSSARENARIRQLRHEGFVRWQIPFTIALLPILLQVAMALFFAGLLDLLWSLHASVAGVITIFVAISLLFLVVTTVMPTIRGDCPYKSPQALGVFLLAQAFTRTMSFVALRIYRSLGWSRTEWPLFIHPHLFSHRRRRFAAWLRSFQDNKYFSNWREREKEIARNIEAKLDHHILVDADATFMDDVFLNNIVRPCIVEVEGPAAFDCLHAIIMHRAHGVEDGIPQWRRAAEMNGGVHLLLHLVTDVLPTIDHGNQDYIVKALLTATSLSRAIPFERRHRDTENLYTRIFESLAKFLSHTGPVRKSSFDLMRDLWLRCSAPVEPTVIQSLALFARSAKQANELDLFHRACEMALALSASPNLSDVDFNSIRGDLQLILEDLEASLTAPTSESPWESAAIILALEELAAHDPDLISTKIWPILDRVVDAPVVIGETDSMPSGARHRLAMARRLRRDRESKPRWQNPQRRKAIDVRGANDLDALNLRLPNTPERRPGLRIGVGEHLRGAPDGPLVESPTSAEMVSPVSLRLRQLPSAPSALRGQGAAPGDSV